MREIIPIWDGAPPGPAVDQPFVPTLTPYPCSAAGGSAAAVIVFPGGGYQMRADHEREPIAEWLNGIGIAAFVLDYRVSPYRHPVPMMDGKRAVRWVRNHAAAYGVDPGRIGILGFSAGGHLAATVGTHYDGGVPDDADPVERESSRPDAMVLCYPVISFGPPRHSGSMTNLLGEHPDPALVEDLSNEKRVTAATPPSFLWHTSADAAVPVENSLLFASALGRAGVPFSLHVYPNGAHGLGLAKGTPGAEEWTRACRTWFAETGFIR